MSRIAKLQKAIYSNIDSLQDLYKTAEGLSGLIEQVSDDTLRKSLTDTYDKVIDTLGDHIDTTEELLKALKKALNE